MAVAKKPTQAKTKTSKPVAKRIVKSDDGYPPLYSVDDTLNLSAYLKYPSHYLNKAEYRGVEWQILQDILELSKLHKNKNLGIPLTLGKSLDVLMSHENYIKYLKGGMEGYKNVTRLIFACDCLMTALAYVRDSDELCGFGLHEYKRAIFAMGSLYSIAGIAFVDEDLRKKAESHQKLSDGGKKGAEKRHAKTYSTQEFALTEYRKKKYKSMMQGARNIELAVKMYAKNIGKPLSENQAFDTIYGWIRADQKV